MDRRLLAPLVWFIAARCSLLVFGRSRFSSKFVLQYNFCVQFARNTSHRPWCFVWQHKPLEIRAIIKNIIDNFIFIHYLILCCGDDNVVVEVMTLLSRLFSFPEVPDSKREPCGHPGYSKASLPIQSIQSISYFTSSRL